MNRGSLTKHRHRLSIYIAAAIFAALAITLVLTSVAKGTIWYFRDSSESTPVNAPTAHQTTDAFARGTWQGRLMTLVQGATAETRTQAFVSGNTGFCRNTTFTSDAISPAQVFACGVVLVHGHSRACDWRSSVRGPSHG